MRIALFSETYLPQRNGVALVLERLVRHLVARGDEVLVATAAEPESEPRSGGHPPGVEIVRVPGIPLPRYPDLRVAPPFSAHAARTVRAFRPDVIHLVTEYSLGLIGLRQARRLGVPAVASFHTNIPRYLPYYGFGWASEVTWRYLRWFHDQARVTLCPSETVRAILLDRGFRDVRIWSRGVDVERFRPALRSAEVRERHGPRDAVHLLYVGRLTPEKDLPVLFDAFRRITESRPELPVQLVLAGDGAYSPKMRARAPSGVTFAGYVEGERLRATYASADAFVFPSRTETLGNVVLEALASGLPVVAVAEGGVLENVKDGVNGLLCPPGDAQTFARRITEIVEQPTLRQRLARNARAWAEERTWERAFEPLVRAYEEAATS
ncbi:MAG: glycosyltransferase family 4 protein [Gemmatimonadales bacterium]